MTSNKIVNHKDLSANPLDGIAGLKQNLTSDALSGFIVFLLALPLSLGIAKASDFPPIMGLITAIIGGMIVSMISGSKLTIKGPAAGLIVVLASAVNDFGGGELGWHLTLGTLFVAAIIQILFGVFKFGKLADFFPLSAIHGMLAAIGIIIIVKQMGILLNDDPVILKGKSPFELIAFIPSMFASMDVRATFIGVISLIIMLGWPYLSKYKISKIPAPLMVILFSVPAEIFMNFSATEPPYTLVHIGSLSDNININVNFDGLSNIALFAKYVIMFALVGSLESLLTVKAIDIMDPWKRKSDYNKDLIAVGIGNLISAVLGGLPMISEVARSSANVNNGARTRWANFFHGFFILIFVLLAAKYIELIPNSALAAMLIAVGIKLTHPREFLHMLKIGKEQLAIFLVTIFFTLFEDLLIGIFAGMILKIIIHLFNGASLSSLFNVPVEISHNEKEYVVTIEKSALFTNFIGIKNRLESIPPGCHVTIDLSNTRLTDHTVLENLVNFRYEYEAKEKDGSVNIVGLEEHKPMSDHALAARKKAVEIKL